MKKLPVLLLLSALVLFFAISEVKAADKKPLGTQCTGATIPNGIGANDECASGDCEESNKKDGYGDNMWYCDCVEHSVPSESCTNQYGAPSDGGEWDCINGSDISWDLDFCESTGMGQIRYPIPANENIRLDLIGRLLNSTANVQTLSSKLADDINDNFEIKIPGLNFTKLTNTLDTEGFLHIPWLGEYIRAIYNFLLAAASAVAIIMIIVQGIAIISSGGGERKTAAYKKIGHIAIGLVIAWSSYAILYTINPNLVQFKSLKVKIVLPAPLPPVDSGLSLLDDTSAPVEVNVSGFAKLSEVSGLRLPGEKERYVNPKLVEDFKLAIADYNASQGDRADAANISVNSTFRSGAEQYDLMIKKCTCRPTSELPPTISRNDINTSYCSACTGCLASCSVARLNGVFTVPPKSHFSGDAMDLSVGQQGSNIDCGKTQDTHVLQSKGALMYIIKNNGVSKVVNDKLCVPQKQQQLIKAMLNHNFCVGMKSGKSSLEAWHFEYTKSGNDNSPFCTANKTDPNIQKLYWVQN